MRPVSSNPAATSRLLQFCGNLVAQTLIAVWNPRVPACPRQQSAVAFQLFRLEQRFRRRVQKNGIGFERRLQFFTADAGVLRVGGVKILDGGENVRRDSLKNRAMYPATAGRQHNPFSARSF